MLQVNAAEQAGDRTGDCGLRLALMRADDSRGESVASSTADTTEPRWLTPEEQRAWIGLGSVLLRLPGILDAQLLRDAGMTNFEYQVLAALSMAPERTLRMSVLAELAEGSLSRLSQVVCRQEKRGWVARRTDPTDGRYTLATLTDAGWEKVVAAAPGHAETVRRYVIDPLTPAQQRQLATIGARIMTAIAPELKCRS